MNDEIIHRASTASDEPDSQERISVGHRRLGIAQAMLGWWQRVRRLTARPVRRLHLAESLSLGDRRFVAVVEFEKQRFLLGGTSGSVVLLARLGRSADDDDERLPYSDSSDAGWREERD